MNIADRVHVIFTEELALDAGSIGSHLSYNSIPEWDSVAHMHLIIALEEAFGLTFVDTEIADLTTVSKIIQTIEQRTDVG